MNESPLFSSIALLRGRLLPRRGDGADSVLVRGGRIARIGTAREILAETTPDAEIFDLGSRDICAGFVDGHAHFLQAGLRGARPELGSSRSRAEALEMVRAALERIDAPEFLVAEGWDESRWTDRAFPDREALDRLSPKRPLLLRRVCGHAAVANSAALNILVDRVGSEGIDSETGLLLEGPALTIDVIFIPTDAEIDAAFDRAGRLCLRRGITTTCDFLRGPMLSQYESRRRRGALPIRVVAYLVEEGETTVVERGTLFDAPAERDFEFVVVGRKIFADGSIGARTAALSRPYADRPQSLGTLLLDADAIARRIAAAHEDEISLAVHAIGDRAIGAVLEAFARFPADANRARRHRIEHLELPGPDDSARLARIGLAPCMQPNFVAEWGRPGGMYEDALGAQRTRAMNPLQSTRRANCGLFFGSDGMPTSALYGIASALTHPNPEERPDLDDAISLYTNAAARGLVANPAFGTLAPGCIADLVVLPRDFSWTEASAASEVDLTFQGGRLTHRSAAWAALPAGPRS